MIPVCMLFQLYVRSKLYTHAQCLLNFQAQYEVACQLSASLAPVGNASASNAGGSLEVRNITDTHNIHLSFYVL